MVIPEIPGIHEMHGDEAPDFNEEPVEIVPPSSRNPLVPLVSGAMEAGDIIRELDLKPATCGFMRQTWDNSHGAALFFLITPDRPGAVHSLDADQMYHFYAGAPLEVTFLTAPGQLERHLLGAFGAGPTHQPQLIIPAWTIHGSRTTGAFTLACTTSFSGQSPRATQPTADQQKQMAKAGFH